MISELKKTKCIIYKTSEPNIPNTAQNIMLFLNINRYRSYLNSWNVIFSTFKIGIIKFIDTRLYLWKWFSKKNRNIKSKEIFEYNKVFGSCFLCVFLFYSKETLLKKTPTEITCSLGSLLTRTDSNLILFSCSENDLFNRERALAFMIFKINHVQNGFRYFVLEWREKRI